MGSLFTSQQSQLQLPRAHRNGCDSHQYLLSCIQPQSPPGGCLRCWHVDWCLSEVTMIPRCSSILAWVKGLVEERKSLLSGRRGREESCHPRTWWEAAPGGSESVLAATGWEAAATIRQEKRQQGKGQIERETKIYTLQSSKYIKVINGGVF